MMIGKMVLREHVFVHAKHGTRHPKQWQQKNLKLHHVWLCPLPHEHNKISVICWIYGLVAYASRKTMSHGMGKAQSSV
jgi:hypothetical protein